MARKDLYETLGVKRGAGKEEIRKAHRKRALATHPDRNPGDERAEAEFKEAQRAYLVLSDDTRRRRYDETGEADEPRPDNSKALTILALTKAYATTMNEVIQTGTKVRHKNVLAMMRKFLGAGLAEVRANVKKMEACRDAIKESMARFDGAGPVLEGVMRGQLDGVEESIRKLRDEEAPAAAALEYLKKCKYRFEPAPSCAPSPSCGGNAATFIFRIDQP